MGSSAMISAGSAGDRHRDHHPLAQARRRARAGRPNTALRLRNTDRAHQPHRLLSGPGDLGDLVAHPMVGLRERHRVLEDDAEGLPANPALLVGPRGGHVDAGDPDGAGHGRPGAGRKKPHHGQAHHRLAGAGLADHGQDLAAGDVEVDAVQDLVGPAAARQRDPEVADLHHRWIAGQIGALLGDQDAPPGSCSFVSLISSSVAGDREWVTR